MRVIGGLSRLKTKTKKRLDRLGVSHPICIPCFTRKTDAAGAKDNIAVLLAAEVSVFVEGIRKRWNLGGLSEGRAMMAQIDAFYSDLYWAEFWLQKLLDRVSFRSEEDRYMSAIVIARTVKKINTIKNLLFNSTQFMARHVSVEYAKARHDANLFVRREWVRNAVFVRDHHACVQCGSMDDLTVDHIIPIARGGTNEMKNFQSLCRKCNSRKCDSLPRKSVETFGH